MCKQYGTRIAAKNYFAVPNEVFSINLESREIALYCFLLKCENRKTYQCWPSYRTIGKALQLCENTVSKYVRKLEDRGLITTKATTIQSKRGRRMNGSLMYRILPMQQAIDRYMELQIKKAEEVAEIQRTQERMKKLGQKTELIGLKSPCKPIFEKRDENIRDGDLMRKRAD